MSRFLHFLLPAIFAVAAGVAHYFEWFYSLELLIYDEIQQFNEPNQPDDIVIIAIDEQSLQSLGRWPWPRRYHAELVNRLTTAESKAIVFDVIFAEPNFQAEDEDNQLAQAISRNKRVVLPIHIEELRHKGQVIEILPFDTLQSSAAGIGHVHIHCDTDGICRSIYLKEGVGSAYWPHLSLALHNLVSSSATSLTTNTANNTVDIKRSEDTSADPNTAMLIFRDQHKLIPFSSIKNPFQTISYVDVLNGKIPLSLLKDKVIFVGATSAGLNDVLATPTGPMSGVAINALAYDALRTGAFIEAVDRVNGAVFISLFTLALLTLFTLLSPSQLLMSTISTCLILFFSSHFLLLYFKTWFPPASIIIVVASFYPLWSWFRLEIALRFLRRSLKYIQDQSPQPGLQQDKANKEFHGIRQFNSPTDKRKQFQARYGSDVVSKTIDSIFKASQIVESSRKLITESLSQLQEAVLVFDIDGNPLLKNSQAEALLSHIQDAHTQDPLTQDSQTQDRANKNLNTNTNLYELGHLIKLSNDIQWDEHITGLKNNNSAFELEGHIATIDRHDKENVMRLDLFIRGRRVSLDNNKKHESKTDLMIITLTDVTLLKESERARIETLNFISHDLRSPMVSILALLEKSRQENTAQPELLSDIERYVTRNLTYAESLLQLGRAENILSQDFDLCDLHAITESACLQTQAIAENKNIKILCEKDDCDLWVSGNGDLLERALINLVSNAVKYSPEGSTTRIKVCKKNNEEVHISVEDEGHGISEKDEKQLFQRFKRGEEKHGQSGAGLGLFFVKTVAEKHGGSIKYSPSALGNSLTKGSIFKLTLPLCLLDNDLLSD